MKKYTSYSLIAFFAIAAVAFAAPDKAAIEAKEKEAWQTFKDKNAEGFKKVDEKDVAVVTYTVKVEGTLDGKDMSGTYNAGSVWKQEKGKWMAIFHTNIKAETAAK